MESANDSFADQGAMVPEARRSRPSRDKLARSRTALMQRTVELNVANSELESFSSAIAHDLRSPLRKMAGFSEVLTQAYGPALPPGARRYLESIQDGALQMGRLLDDLLLLAKVSRQHLSLASHRLDSIVHAALAEIEAQYADRRIEWSIGDLPIVRCDGTMMTQAFIHLLDNAVKFTRGRNPAVIEIGCETGNPVSVFFVRDNGVGFDMRHAARLFGIFQRLHPTQGFAGTGVGLATVERIMRKHDGRVWAEAQPDRGATFFFTLDPCGAVSGCVRPHRDRPDSERTKRT